MTSHTGDSNLRVKEIGANFIKLFASVCLLPLVIENDERGGKFG